MCFFVYEVMVVLDVPGDGDGDGLVMLMRAIIKNIKSFLFCLI